MRNAKKSLSALFFSLVTLTTFSQNLSTYSPYSRYGIGEIRTRGYANTLSMSGLSQGIRTGTTINFLNPASYSAQDTMSFIFDFGMEGSSVNYSSQGQNNYNTIANVHHVAMQFPITKKWGASLGIQPFSHVGYRIRHLETDPYLLSSIGVIKYYHTGQGGISQAFMGTGYEVFKGLSLGVNMSYLFGALDYNTDVVFPSDVPFLSTYKRNSVIVRSLAFSVGAQYDVRFGKEKAHRLVLGFTLDNETAVGAKRSTVASWQVGNVVETFYEKEDEKSSIDFPANYTGGFTFTYKNKLMIGADYSSQDWSKALFLGVSDSLSRSNTLRVGAEFTPNRTDLKSYTNRISYRAGFRATDSYLNLKGNQIKDYGISFGVGLPFRRTNTSFNISFELGTRGTTNNGLIKENYGIINLGVTFYDYWFIKRKFN